MANLIVLQLLYWIEKGATPKLERMEKAPFF
jgi:hypothetical protein